MKRLNPLPFLLLTGLLLTACNDDQTKKETAPALTFKSFTAAPATVTQAGTVTLSADVTSTAGLQKVAFYRGDQLIAEDTSAPYTAQDQVTASQNGTVTYHAVATDSGGHTTNSQNASVTVNIKPATDAPTAALDVQTTPQGQVTLNVTASSNAGIAKVEFYDNNQLVNTVTVAPYSAALQYTAAQNGSHTYRVKVFDTVGQSTEISKTATVNVASVSTLKVALQAEPVKLTREGDIVYTATADSDVTRVDFYDNGLLLASLNTGPYTVKQHYSYSVRGQHTIRAVAYDAQGHTSEANTTVNIDLTSADAYEPNDSVAAATPLTSGTPLNATISGQPRDFDYFKFSATAGDKLKLTVKSVSVLPWSTLDPYVVILMPDGKTIVEKDDDSGLGLESEIRLNVPQTGTYTAVVTSFNIHEDPKVSDDKYTNAYQIAMSRR